MAALCGVPVARIVHGDVVEAALWLRVAARAAEVRQEMLKAQASHNAAQVSRIFRK